MAFEIDHLFVLAAIGAPEAGRLLDAGFIEGSPNTHHGQGTANRRFFFADAMLEFLWVTDPADAQAPPARDLHLWPRWTGRGSGASPFGVCVRPTAKHADDGPAPFAYWQYRPAYARAPISIGANAARIDEPLLFALPRAAQVTEVVREEPRKHANGVSALRSVCLSAPAAGLASDEIRTLADIPGLHFEPSATHLLDITFDGSGTHVVDCRPALPLILRW
jgi:hypothetical protein